MGKCPTAVRLLIEITLHRTQKMPLACRLLTGDGDFNAALDEMPPEAMKRGTAMGQDFSEQIIAAAVAPLSLDSRHLTELAQLVQSFGFVAVHIGAPHARCGLSLEKYAQLFAETFAAGVRHAAESQPPPRRPGTRAGRR